MHRAQCCPVHSAAHTLIQNDESFININFYPSISCASEL